MDLTLAIFFKTADTFSVVSLLISHAFYNVKNVDIHYLSLLHVLQLSTKCTFERLDYILCTYSLQVLNSIPVSASHDALHIKEHSSKLL